ncbi:MAG: hypothetical protein ACTHMW_03045 [Actinomycetes bacterium]
MTTPQPPYTLELRQRFTVVQNRWDLFRIDGGGERQLAYAEQKRFSLKEKVTFFEADGGVAFTIGARNIMEIRGTYDVLDGAGQQLATITKQFKASLTRSTYSVTLPDGRALTAAERGSIKPIARRIVGLASDFPWPFPIHFDVAGPDGRLLAAVERQMRIRDVYRITVADGSLDWRVAAALGVATDAFMNR